MALLTSSSRRFTRSRNYSFEARRIEADRVHHRIDLVDPRGTDRRRSQPAGHRAR